jgi:hypothetical protein
MRVKIERQEDIRDQVRMDTGTIQAIHSRGELRGLKTVE